MIGGAPLIANTVFELTPSHQGLLFGFTPLGYMVGNFLSGRYSVAVGMNRMILIGAILTLGFLVASLGLAVWDLHNEVSFYTFFFFMGVGNGLTLPNASAGLMSVRPHLAGTASGIGGVLMTGGGAVIAALTGATLGGGNPVVILLIWMVLSSLIAAALALWVIWVARRAGPLEVEV
jgi:DHA1 family bicyclomycin/chloramphenicol resistance-like MFS transporter